MNSCAFHPNNFAVVQCNSCARALCPACDHRIRGFPFCADCIVSGIELLRLHQENPHAKPRNASPILATIFSLFCPGLGAAYNGQTAKAIVHFAFFVSFFQMAILTNGMALFVLGFMGVWLFAAIDAWRTARGIRLGASNGSLEDLWMQKLIAKPLVWAIAFISLGTLFFLHTTLNVRLPVEKALPVLLVALGVYWIVGYIRRKRGVAIDEDATRVSPVIAGNFPNYRSEYSSTRTGSFTGHPR